MGQITSRELQRTLRSQLPASVFVPVSRRAWWLVLHATSAALGLTFGWVQSHSSGAIDPIYLLPVACVLSLNYAGLAFVAHEALHGAIFRNNRLKRLLGHIGFAPFWVSPDLWMAWHNRVHHPNTNVAGKDPDAYPSLKEYNESTAARWAVRLGSPHMGKWRGIVTLLFGFTLQSLQVLLQAKKRGHLNQQLYRRALIQSGGVFAAWILWGIAVGPLAFFSLYVLPLMGANAIVMSYIVTNHSLHRLVDQDDTLQTTLSVTVPKWYEIYSLQFGYHTEHHLFPTMSHVYGPLVQQKLLLLAEERYSVQPLGRALRTIFSTPRVYRDQTWLFDPPSGALYPTLGEADPPGDSVQMELVASADERSQVRLRHSSEAPPAPESHSA